MAKLASNSMEGKAEGFLKRIEAVHAELESERGKYMAACRPLREDIKDLYVEAKDAGVPAKALRALVKHRQLEKQQHGLSEGLDIDEQATFETLVEALGPLGRAAAKAAGVEVDDDKDVRPRHLKDKTEARADEAALDKVGKGAAVDSLAH